MCRSGGVAMISRVDEWYHPKARYKSFPWGKLARPVGETDEGNAVQRETLQEQLAQRCCVCRGGNISRPPRFEYNLCG